MFKVRKRDQIDAPAHMGLDAPIYSDVFTLSAFPVWLSKALWDIRSKKPQR